MLLESFNQLLNQSINKKKQSTNQSIDARIN